MICLLWTESHGGLPIFADGDIFLCGRTDHNPERHFDGSVTQLSIYDVRLTEEQVQDLYHAVASSGLIASDTLSFARNEDKEQDRIDNYEESPQKVSFSGVGDINEFRHDDYAATSTLCTGKRGALCPESLVRIFSFYCYFVQVLASGTQPFCLPSGSSITCLPQ